MNEIDDLDQGAEGVEISDDILDGEGSNTNSMVTNIVIVVAVLLFQGVSSHFIVKNVFFSKTPAEKALEVKAEESSTFGEIYELSGLLINPKGSRGKSHLLIDLGFEYQDLLLSAELEKRAPQLRDKITTFLASQSVQVVTDITFREKIRGRIKEIVNFTLNSGEIDHVYFIRYVFQ